MLTRFDDYLVHQTPEPIAQPSSGDRNCYDRYFFNGYSRDGDLFFAAALGLYPNRRVMDAAFSVVRDGTQYVLRASRLAPVERAESRVGPIFVEVLEPLRALHVRVGENEHGIEADLAFYARTAALEEPRFVHKPNNRVMMDSTRLTQFGFWEGYIRIDGEEIVVDPSKVPGCRDRSWGVRPVGEPEGGAPGMPPQFFWLWSPLHFDDFCTHLAVNEDGRGRPWHASGFVAPVALLDEGSPEPMASVGHAVCWTPGTRRASSAELTLRPHAREPMTIALQPILTFQMRGLGYLDPEWGHGMWKGESALDRVTWTLADLDPMDPRHIHVQQLVRARLGDREGLGVLETLVLGPHGPSGFTSILDPAPG
jgi:hypothetical protein